MTYTQWLYDYQLCINRTYELPHVYWLTYNMSNVKLYEWHGEGGTTETILSRLAASVRGDSIKASLERELMALALGQHKVDALLKIGGGK